MINKFKIFGLVGIFIFLFGFISLEVSAIGVGFSQIIELHPGQSIDRSISLQNLPVGGGDLKFIGVITEGMEYVSLDDDDVRVNDGEIGHVAIKISVPDSANVGDTYPVKIKFNTAEISQIDETDSGNAVQFNLGTGISFDVIVIEKPLQEEQPASGELSLIWIILGIILLIAIVAIIWFIIKNRKTSLDINLEKSEKTSVPIKK